MDIVSKEAIEKGWSGDKKYKITAKDGTHYLLRISEHSMYDKKKSQFEKIKAVERLDIPMCRPIEFGISEQGVYMVFSWIDGEDAEFIIPKLASEKQYSYGLDAGRILKRIHEISAPDSVELWNKRFNRKIDHKIKGYLACPLQYENGDAFIDYIETNRYLLYGRPQVYQHGDYHIGNMMVDKNGHLNIIDFDRDDYGDPWEEFNRIVWCAQKAPYFASGMVDGYFEKDIPMDFWKLLALYISSNTLSSLYWAIPFGESEIKTMKLQARDILKWYDGMKNIIPTWYKNSDF